ncbi:hypothetical protein H8E52_06605 [bacterium]|nr:hypothetical protein [bacterium]
MMKFLLLLLAGVAGWRFLLRPWFVGRERNEVPDDPRFRGEQVQDADFEVLDDQAEGESKDKGS